MDVIQEVLIICQNYILLFQNYEVTTFHAMIAMK